MSLFTHVAIKVGSYHTATLICRVENLGSMLELLANGTLILTQYGIPTDRVLPKPDSLEFSIEYFTPEEKAANV